MRPQGNDQGPAQGHAQLSVSEGITATPTRGWRRKTVHQGDSLFHTAFTLLLHLSASFQDNRCCYKSSLPFSFPTTSTPTPHLTYIALNVALHLSGFFPLVASLLCFMEEMVLNRSRFLPVSRGCQCLLWLRWCGTRFRASPANGCHQHTAASQSPGAFRAAEQQAACTRGMKVKPS